MQGVAPSLVLTLPNLLTLLRILAVPCFAIALWYGHRVEACLLFAGAGVTDLLDGFIARRFNQRSSLGAILDPAADKLLMTTAFLMMAFAHPVGDARIPAWVAILAIARDIVIAAVALLWAGDFDPERFLPTRLGKWTTAVELVAISAGLCYNAVPELPHMAQVMPWLYRAVAFFVLASGFQYFFRASQRLEAS